MYMLDSKAATKLPVAKMLEFTVLSHIFGI